MTKSKKEFEHPVASLITTYLLPFVNSCLEMKEYYDEIRKATERDKNEILKKVRNKLAVIIAPAYCRYMIEGYESSKWDIDSFIVAYPHLIIEDNITLDKIKNILRDDYKHLRDIQIKNFIQTKSSEISSIEKDNKTEEILEEKAWSDKLTFANIRNYTKRYIQIYKDCVSLIENNYKLVEYTKDNCFHDLRKENNDIIDKTILSIVERLNLKYSLSKPETFIYLYEAVEYLRDMIGVASNSEDYKPSDDLVTWIDDNIGYNVLGVRKWKYQDIDVTCCHNFDKNIHSRENKGIIYSPTDDIRQLIATFIYWLYQYYADTSIRTVHALPKNLYRKFRIGRNFKHKSDKGIDSFGVCPICNYIFYRKQRNSTYCQNAKCKAEYEAKQNYSDKWSKYNIP